MELFYDEKHKRKVLEDTKVFVLDMDGTFYLSEDIFPYSLHFLDVVKKCNKDFMFFTNNSSKVGEDYIEKLRKMNCIITKEKIMTSGDVAIRFLNTFYKDKTVFLLGTPNLEADFKKHNIHLVDIDTKDIPDIVMMSFDKSLSYDKVERACSFIRLGSIFLSTHPDINCPISESPYFIPDCGAFCKAIELSTGVAPRFLGKPYKETLDMVAGHVGLENEKEKITFVGDRLYTDIAVAVNNGAKGALVLSGESTKDTVSASDVKPSAVYENLGEMAKLLQEIYNIN